MARCDASPANEASLVDPVLWTCLSALATILGACAVSPRTTESCEQHAVLADACIRVESLAEWDSIDDRTLLLWAPDATRAYLLGLGKPIAELRLADEIDVVDGDLDRLICPCSSIEYLSESRTVELLGYVVSARY